MAKLIPLEEAAKMLNVSVDKLKSMQEKGEIFGYRDGSNWKFKEQELDRVAGELGKTLVELSSDNDLDFSLSDEEIGIAESDEQGSDGSASMELDDSEDLILEDDSSEVSAMQDSENLALDDQDSELQFGESDLQLAAESSGLLDDDSAEKPGASDTGNLSEELSLAEDDLYEDELEIHDSAALEDSVELDSDFGDSDLVLDESDSSSEVVMEGKDSGINLSPNDSGISLDEEPLELGGSDIDSLELPEDDEMITLEDAPAGGTQLGDDDFNLTPLEDSVDDESSGSQVIALEDSEIYADDSSGAVLTESDAIEQPALLPAEAEPSFVPALAPEAYAAEVPEHPYTIGQVISLGLVAIPCLLGLVMAFDICQMYGSGGTQLSSTVVDFFSDALGMKGSQ